MCANHAGNRHKQTQLHKTSSHRHVVYKVSHVAPHPLKGRPQPLRTVTQQQVDILTKANLIAG